MASSGAAIMKRIIKGFEVDWASERVFAEQQTAPNYGYLFEVSADRKRIVRCAHISAIGGDSDNPNRDAERLEKDARQAVEEFLGLEREGKRGASRRYLRSSPGPPLHLRITKIARPRFNRTVINRPLSAVASPRRNSARVPGRVA